MSKKQDECSPGSPGYPLVPVPSGMSDGFYAFMGTGGVRSPSGEIMMLGIPAKILNGSETSTYGSALADYRRVYGKDG